VKLGAIRRFGRVGALVNRLKRNRLVESQHDAAICDECVMGKVSATCYQ
jgi:hypothetical protein